MLRLTVVLQVMYNFVVYSQRFYHQNVEYVHVNIQQSLFLPITLTCAALWLGLKKRCKKEEKWLDLVLQSFDYGFGTGIYILRKWTIKNVTSGLVLVVWERVTGRGKRARVQSHSGARRHILVFCCPFSVVLFCVSFSFFSFLCHSYSDSLVRMATHWPKFM